MASMRDMRATGATARQVDHWTRGGRLRSDSPESVGAGHRRSWPDEEVGVCRLLVRLTSAGLGIEQAERVARGEYEIGPGVLVFVNPDDSPGTVAVDRREGGRPRDGRRRDAK